MRRRLPFASRIEAVDDRSCRVRVGADSPALLAIWIGALDADFEVVGPPELLEVCRVLAARFARAAATAGVHSSPVSGPQITPFEVTRTAIDGLVVLTMKQIAEPRGTVRELFRTSAMFEAGLHAGPWQQINVTETIRGAVRGLHGESMTKLVAIVAGSAFGAYVDTRPGSPSLGRVVTAALVPGRQVLVPAGVCNGFQSTSDEPSQYVYCFDAEWVPGMSGTAVHPLDPALGIEWPLPIDPADPSRLSAKDAAQPTLAQAIAAQA